MKNLLIVLLIVLSPQAFAMKFKELALTPPMGWNSWNTFACDIDETKIRDMADAMVSSGLKDAGYQYINIDDCWHGERDQHGNIQADKKHFPSGIAALANYVHSKGLKLGIYSDAGWKTCAGKPGSRGYEFQDAKQYAAWGVDYVKYDWCNTEGLKAEGAYLTMREAIYAAKRPMVFSICEWGDNQPWQWAPDIGHLWRISGDIYNCWDCEHKHNEGTPNAWSSWGVLKILDQREALNLRTVSGSGRWNDMDMLEVGNGMSEHEDQSHFTMWAFNNSPLIAGNDLRNMSDVTKSILTNKDIIAINQDPLGVQAFKYSNQDGIDIWFKPMADGNWAMAVLNRNNTEATFQFNFDAHKIVDPDFGHDMDLAKTKYQIRDIWNNQDRGTTGEKLKAVIQPHATLALTLIKLKGH